MTRRSQPRGFTLIELMVVVTIVGMLSSVALPMYRRATLRSRAAERATILESMRTGIENAFFVEKIVPAAPGGLSGAPNPAGVAGPGKRHFANNWGDWGKISLVVQGDCYYTYSFTANETGNGAPAAYFASAVGNLDGDTTETHKSFDAERRGGRWAVVEDPPLGEEDDVTFGSF